MERGMGVSRFVFDAIELGGYGRETILYSLAPSAVSRLDLQLGGLDS
jgi:hypothetical protein